MLDTVEHYLHNSCELTFIDPHTKLLADLIGSAAHRVQIFEKPVQQVPLATFDSLEAGDILFIDSTHVMRTGGDVCFELFEIFPRLTNGVIVHIHDIFWPFEYPRQWVLNENRSWNEIYAIRAFLTENDEWRIVLFSDYLAKLEAGMILETYPAFLKNSGVSLWIERC